MEHSNYIPKCDSYCHHNNRDCAIDGPSSSGPSSRSATFKENALSDHTLAYQRHSLRSVQEALDLATSKIKQLEAQYAHVNGTLTERNRENRALKRERAGLLKENEELLSIIDDLNQSPKEEDSPRGGTTGSYSGKVEGREELPTVRRRPLTRYGSGESAAMRERAKIRFVPPAPPNPHPNPFAQRIASAAVAVPPVLPVRGFVASQVLYSSEPVRLVKPVESEGLWKGDGKYHLRPL